MSRWCNIRTGVVVSVDDGRDHRFGAEWEPADKPVKESAPKSKSKK